MGSAWGLLASAATVTLFTSTARAGCPPPPPIPDAPVYATDLNGVAWPELCVEPRGIDEHFFIIGDWGGLFQGIGQPPRPADAGKRPFVWGVDERAQLLVAEQMRRRAAVSKPLYILNVGDNFYWGGINTPCGLPANIVMDSATGQWESVFLSVYSGPDLGHLPWMGVLGNHDYGGYMFTKGWDQAIAYTWGPSERWLTPALFWSRRVRYADFSVDYYFVDSNVNDAFPEWEHPNHNMCSHQNNPPNATCGPVGPTSTADCLNWFLRLWDKQVLWMESRLAESDVEWQIVVTHFPPDYRADTWARLAEKYGIDLFVTGHRHMQEVHYREPWSPVGETAWVVSGGGGGILSEGAPSLDGQDDQYGFMDVTIWRDGLKIEALSHTGVIRSTTMVEPRRRPTTTTSKTTSTATPSTTSTTATTTVMTHAPPKRWPRGVATGKQPRSMPGRLPGTMARNTSSTGPVATDTSTSSLARDQNSPRPGESTTAGPPVAASTTHLVSSAAGSHFQAGLLYALVALQVRAALCMLVNIAA